MDKIAKILESHRRAEREEFLRELRPPIDRHEYRPLLREELPDLMWVGGPKEYGLVTGWRGDQLRQGHLDDTCLGKWSSLSYLFDTYTKWTETPKDIDSWKPFWKLVKTY